MKYLYLPISLASAMLFASCASNKVSRDGYAKAIRNQGYVPYNRPIGDTANPKDWGKLGPGAIIRVKQQTHYQTANTLIGDGGVIAAMNSQNSSPIALLNGTTVSGFDFDAKGGWSLGEVSKIAAAANLKNDKTVEIKFGQSYLASVKSEREMHDTLRLAGSAVDSTTRKALRDGTFAVVLNAVFTDSMRYTFKQTNSSGASVDYTLTSQETASLQAKGYKIVNNSIEVTRPTFIAYSPLPDVRNDFPKP